MRGSDRKLCFTGKEGGSLGGVCECTMNEENDYNHDME